MIAYTGNECLQATMMYLSLLLRFILKHLGFMIFLSVTIFPFIRHNSCSCLSLTVASSRFSPSNILLTHDCGTLSPVLPINPHHRHLGPPSRLSLSLLLIQRALQTLQVWAISASSARAFITGHEACCFYCTDRQTAREELFRSLT